MRHPNDNIDQRYEILRQDPENLNYTLKQFNESTEKTYSAFTEIITEHDGVGKAILPIMAMNQASHILKVAEDRNLSRTEKKFKIHQMIAPMFCLMYDRFTAESLENLMDLLDDGKEGNENA